MVMRSTLRFMLSQFSTDFSSAIRRSTSLMAVVGALKPASGRPIGPQRFLRNSKGSGGGFMIGALKKRIPASLLSRAQKLQQLGAARHGVLIPQVDQRPAITFLEEQIAREIGSVAIHSADAAQQEPHGPRQL